MLFPLSLSSNLSTLLSLSLSLSLSILIFSLCISAFNDSEHIQNATMIFHLQVYNEYIDCVQEKMSEDVSLQTIAIDHSKCDERECRNGIYFTL